jgi:Pyruvate/2-oxoacid:ferredoxin oxidoreductase gamma subunit
MRSGTSNCHVRIAREPIASPLVTAPNILVAMNEPSLRKFDTHVPSGGWILYNGDAFPEECRREDIHILALPFTRIADELGDARAANMVILGALLEITQALPEASVNVGWRRMVKDPRWIALDERAMRRGRELTRDLLPEK